MPSVPMETVKILTAFMLKRWKLKAGSLPVLVEKLQIIDSVKKSRVTE